MIRKLHRQETIMLYTKTRRIPDRIVNLVQRQVRPMVRGKARAAVEFGAKISVSVRNGFAFLHRISWDPHNEAKVLISQAKKYKRENGCYPERICADRIYISTKNRNLCTKNNIRPSGKRLGRPPKAPQSTQPTRNSSAQTNESGTKWRVSLDRGSENIHFG
jgi:hypothetical protein